MDIVSATGGSALDNGTTACTACQEHPAAGYFLVFYPGAEHDPHPAALCKDCVLDAEVFGAVVARWLRPVESPVIALLDRRDEAMAAMSRILDSGVFREGA